MSDAVGLDVCLAADIAADLAAGLSTGRAVNLAVGLSVDIVTGLAVWASRVGFPRILPWGLPEHYRGRFCGLFRDACRGGVAVAHAMTTPWAAMAGATLRAMGTTIACAVAVPQLMSTGGPCHGKPRRLATEVCTVVVR